MNTITQKKKTGRQTLFYIVFLVFSQHGSKPKVANNLENGLSMLLTLCLCGFSCTIGWGHVTGLLISICYCGLILPYWTLWPLDHCFPTLNLGPGQEWRDGLILSKLIYLTFFFFFFYCLCRHVCHDHTLSRLPVYHFSICNFSTAVCMWGCNKY